MRESTNVTTANERPGTTRRRLAVIAAAGVRLAAAAPAAQAAGVTADHSGAGSGKVAIGFFTQWSIYSGFMEKNLIADGAASKPAEVTYAFSSLSADGLCTSGDSGPDSQRPSAAPESVSGAADAAGQTLAGNFNQLK